MAARTSAAGATPLVAPANRETAGAALLHPLSLAAASLWALNDHFWKWRAPSALTGKLSDICGLIVVPLLLVSVLEMRRKLAGRPVSTRPGEVVAACALVGAVFAAVNTIPVAAEAYRTAFAALLFPLRVLTHAAERPPFVHHTLDPTDLLALPVLYVAYRLATSRKGRRG